jgi:hypothetical protein
MAPETVFMKALTLLRCLAIAALPSVSLSLTAAISAQAGEPHGNVDHDNDMANDSRRDGGQFNENDRGPVVLRAPASNLPTAQTPPACAPR